MNNQESKWIWLEGRTYNIDLMRSISFQESIDVYRNALTDTELERLDSGKWSVTQDIEKLAILNQLTYATITWSNWQLEKIAIPDSNAGKMAYERLTNLTSKCSCGTEDNIYDIVAKLQVRLEEMKENLKWISRHQRLTQMI